ncbi:MAG: hypothetical protein KGL39_36790 [Patescibacteria group bacterium]|nr:hypothetical protein [Patescibacteria group bacterium]
MSNQTLPAPIENVDGEGTVIEQPTVDVTRMHLRPAFGAMERSGRALGVAWSYLDGVRDDALCKEIKGEISALIQRQAHIQTRIEREMARRERTLKGVNDGGQHSEGTDGRGGPGAGHPAAQESVPAAVSHGEDSR